MKALWGFLILLMGQVAGAQLPASWHGQWRGECLIQKAGTQGAIERVATRMLVRPEGDGQWSWELTYQGTPNRPYKLLQQGRDRFLLDENNGIVIAQTLFRSLDSFSSLFQVAGKLISVQEHVEGNVMTVTMATHTLDRPLSSGTPDGQNPVISYHPTHLQRCLLKRQ